MKDINMPTSYDHLSVEDKIYGQWEAEGRFKATTNKNKPPYCIVMPPPNITGQLHMGHALDETIQDVLIRYKRMCGFEALWLPGTDHASIATEVKILEQLKKEGKSKENLSRDEFLKYAWAWREKYGRRIVSQLKKLGSSCDWERERFTMDDGCSRAVTKVFVKLYNEGLIYRGNRIINRCPVCKTALSDAEVEYEERDSFLWHVKYNSPEGHSIVCATTRPETILGDTAIAVNPEDKRYCNLVGKTVIVPVIGREIPIVADEYVEAEFGTGAVKITPSHDPNDFEVGLRHNLKHICVFTNDGHINELGGKYEGLTTAECRKVFTEDLKAAGALIKQEPYTHNVGACYRCHATVEPLVSKQWFVDMKPLAAPAIKAVESGEIKFVPERFSGTYFNWLNNIRDWCISRQLWWGHRIPAWYCDDCGEITVAEATPAACCACGSTSLCQDNDVLDTWFSSGMWPFSTLGWPEKTDELDYFYPTSTLVTGYDIIFFWIARMIVFGLNVMDCRPFDTVYVHGLVRDEQGRKMSKSLNNGIDPLEIIDNFGADSLRFSLITGNSAGNDMRFYTKKVEAARNFCNKIYNASRFVLMNAECDIPAEIDMTSLDLADKWILHGLNETVKAVRAHLDSFDINLAAERVYDFIWSEFCDWYIEMAKPKLYSDNAKQKSNVLAILIRVVGDCMKLLHPFMPFITEELYTRLPNSGDSIMTSIFPEACESFEFAADASAMESIKELIRSIRNIRVEMNVPPSRRAPLILVANNKDSHYCEQAKTFFVKLAGAESVIVQTNKIGIPENAVSAICSIAEAFIPLGSLIDIEKEIERVEKEISKMLSEIERYEGKLNNATFVDKAPAQVVAAERDKLQNALKIIEKLNERYTQLKSI